MSHLTLFVGSMEYSTPHFIPSASEKTYPSTSNVFLISEHSKYRGFNNPGSTLRDIVLSAFKIEYGSPEYEDIYSITIDYLSRGLSAFQYQAALKPFCSKTSKYSAKVFRLKLSNTQLCHLRIKLFCYALAKYKSLTTENIIFLEKEYSIPKIDSKQIVDKFRHDNSFRRRLKEEAREFDFDTHLNLKVIEAAFSPVFKSVMPYVKAKTYMKLRFIANSQNVELADLHNELSVKVLQSFYKMMPCTKTAQHVTNYLKRVIHNHAMNMISKNTSLKGGRLINMGLNGKDNFSRIVSSENQIKPLIEGEDNVSYDEMSSTNPFEAIDLEESVVQILSAVKPGGKKYRFVTILMGVPDKEFSIWLKDKKLIRGAETNADYQMREGVVRFRTHVRNFLNMKEKSMERYLGVLFSSLAMEKTKVNEYFENNTQSVCK